MPSKQSIQKLKTQWIIQLIKEPILPTIFAASLLMSPTTGLAIEFAGTLDRVSITDTDNTNIPPTASFIYTVDGNDVTFDASASVDPDGSITAYKWDFGDGTYGTGQVLSHQYQQIESISVTLSLTDNNNGISLLHQPITGQAPIDISINFQPASSDTPAGYSPDSGEPYSTTTGYGWITQLKDIWAGDRNNPISPNQAYDTYFYAQPSDVWEIAVPNGNYSVTVCIGEPTWPYGTHNAQIENLPIIIDTKLDSQNKWVEANDSVTVNDGRLTLSFEGTSDKSIPTWIQIKTAE